MLRKLIFFYMSSFLSFGLTAQTKSNVHVDITSPLGSVVYVGIDNPLKIVVEGVPDDSIIVSGIGIKKLNSTEYIMRPDHPGIEMLIVFVKTDSGVKTYSFEYRCRRIPNPYPYCGPLQNGTIKLSVLQSTDNITAKNPDFPFQILYPITSFELTYISVSGTVTTEQTEGDTFNYIMKQLISSAQVGDILAFNSIKVKMPDETYRMLSMVLKVN